jgi:hypothetical protein
MKALPLNPILSIFRGRKFLWPALAVSLAALAFATRTAVAQTQVAVANMSFEFPSTTVETPGIDSWQQTPQPGYFDPATDNFTWNQAAGVFLNTPAGASDHINNLDGNQAAYLLSFPGNGITQDLSTPFTAGDSYDLTAGVIGSPGLTASDTLDLILYYRGGSNNIVPVGDTTITFSPALFPNLNNLVYFSVELPAVQPANASNGHNIGIEIIANNGEGSGFWDLDNVQLTSVPEPATGVFLAPAAAALLLCRRRSARRA